MQLWQAQLRAARSRATAAWWSVAGQTCLAAYQAKGAASQAASYANLADPGTYDCTTIAAPTWDGSTGWTFNGTSQWLRTGLLYPGGSDQVWSVALRFANATMGTGPRILCASIGAPTAYRDRGYGIGIRSATEYVFWAPSNAWLTLSTGGGVMIVAGSAAYYNGSPLITCRNSPAAQECQFTIGGAQQKNGSGMWFAPVDVIAAAIYSSTLTAGQAADLTSAMAAL